MLSTYTLEVGQCELGITFTLAWELQFRNDELYGGLSPEHRYDRMLEWVRAHLAASAVAS